MLFNLNDSTLLPGDDIGLGTYEFDEIGPDDKGEVVDADIDTEFGIFSIALAIAYLLGSIPTAILVCHAMGINDPRQQGSGNPGATNVLRIGNHLAAFLTLLGDFAKGLLAVTLAYWLDLSLIQQACCGLAALTGHIWSLFLSFRGGKGVATMIGVCLALNYKLGLLQCLIWLSLLVIRKISSLAAIGMALLSPIISWILIPELVVPILMMSVIIIAAHHENIRKLFEGRESRL